MNLKKLSQSGFTLVELAIVLMIIGLLIGGILKGQELITNARITSIIRQIKSHDAAVITFMDSYGAKPGDITSPSTRLPNCNSAPCSNAGDGNGIIGATDSSTTAENNTAWIHLASANLISGIDPANYTGISTSTLVPVSLGGYAYIINYTSPSSSTWPQGFSGHYYYYRGTSTLHAFPVNALARIDMKMDDGKPYHGDINIDSASCGIASGATAYNSVSNLCSFLVKTGW